MSQGVFRRVWSAALVVVATVTFPVVTPYVAGAAAAGDPVIAVAGDIACDPAGNTPTATTCQEGATSDLLMAMNPTAVLTVGDNQYESGALSAFQASYDPTWGRVKSLTHPTPGNHEYTTAGASGYYSYFGAAAGDPSQGWYSYDIGAWHVVALNAECSSIGGCGSGSPEETWLRSDLAAHGNACVLAYWHQPRWSTSAAQPSNATYDVFWKDLYAAGAELVLNGHAHDYERFAPQSPDGRVDVANGIREFVVGTGGKSHYTFDAPMLSDEARDASTFGVLSLSLHDTSYDWSFHPIAGSTFTDSGHATCHGAGVPADTVPPTAPSGLSATATSSTSVALAWTPGSDDSGTVAHRIYRNGTVLATVGNVGSYTDTTATPGTSYSYSVDAVDGAGNSSTAAGPVGLTTPGPAAGQTFTFTPTDDAYVDQTNATTNYGASTRLVADASPVDDFLVRFNVQTSACTITDAKLSLTVGTTTNDNSGSGGTVHPTDAAWTEGAVTWSTAPAAGTTSLGALNGSTLGTTTTTDVAPAVTADGPVAFRVSTASSDGVRYFSKEGSSTQKPTLTVTCAAAPSDTQPPTAPGQPTQVGATDTSMQLSWAASTDDVGVTAYRVLRDGTPVGQTASTSFTDTGLAPQHGYDYTVVAVDAAGNVSPSSPAQAATTTADGSPPTIPTGLTVTGSSTSSVSLQWIASTDDVGVAGYVVNRGDGEVLPVDAPATSVTDTNVTPGASYTYTVSARDTSGNVSAPSNPVTAVVPAGGDSQPPTAPMLAAPTATSTQVSLSWSASTDNVGVAGYTVARDGSTVATVSPSTTSYTDTGLVPGSTHTYVVTAADAAGNTMPSNSRTVTLLGDLVFTTNADTWIAKASPTSNYGSKTYVNVDNSPVTNTLLKFHVTGTAGCTVTRAQLTLTVTNDGSTDGGTVHPVGTGWSESTVTWSNAPAWDASAPSVSLGKVATGTSYTVTLPAGVVTGDGDVGLRIANASSDGVRYYSKEGSATKAATLRVTCG